MDLRSISDTLLSIVRSSKSIIDKELIENIDKKSHQDYVTNLDIAIEKYLMGEISRRLQNIEIFSEESIKDKIDISNTNCIVIDPLDGTLNAIAKLGFHAISMAYLENGEPKIGITYDYMKDEMFYAFNGGGMFINDDKVDSGALPSNETVSISNDFLLRAIDMDPKIIKKIREFGKIRILGSQALHLAYVASGRLKININFEAILWDDVAGYVMLKEVGLSYKNFSGKDIFPRKILNPKENLLSIAGNARDLSEVQNLIKDI